MHAAPVARETVSPLGKFACHGIFGENDPFGGRCGEGRRGFQAMCDAFGVWSANFVLALEREPPWKGMELLHGDPGDTLGS